MKKKIAGLYAVMGSPIEHSFSPVIHQLFADQFNWELNFEKIEAQQTEFIQTVDTFRKKDGIGINITMPLKQIAAKHCDQLSDIAEKTGATSHIWWNEKNELCGANTDGIGMIRDIEKNLGFDINNKRILLIGSGGAARGVIFPLLEKKPDKLTIVNRTMQKAIQMVENLHITDQCNIVSPSDLTDHSSFDLVINATSSSLQGSLPTVPENVIKNARCCYDLVYGKTGKTVFVKAAEDRNIPAADGLGMLIEHNAEVFYHWFKRRPETQPVINRFLKKS